MWKTLTFCAALLVSAPAWAQMARSPQVPTDPDIKTVMFAYQQLATAIGELVQAKNSEVSRLEQQVAALKQKALEMDAYLKACGDKPGCTVPVKGATK